MEHKEPLALLVCLHKPFPVPQSPLLRPVQVGAALAGEAIPGCARDDGGENISERNPSYCELTAQYWAWKNLKADYYGFFHYRRYLYPGLTAKRPYRVEARPTAELLDKLGWDRFPALIRDYDLIAPRGEDMRRSVRAHYAGAKHHRGADLELMEAIVREKTPEYAGAMEEYLSGSVCYFGNLYVMARPLFERYCGWLFPLLAEFDRRADWSGRDAQELRVDGYLAERLFGVFYTRVRAEGARTLELPRVDFIPDDSARRRRKVLNALLPPGSRRRGWVKGLAAMGG